MNVNKLKFLALDALVFVSRYWYLLLAAAVLLGGLWWFDSCRARRVEKKIERLDANIRRAEVEANVLSNQKANLANEVNNYAKNSNQAADDFNRSLRTDSNRFKGSDAGKRFCERFPEDSSCR